MPTSPIISIKPLVQRWDTLDPFLFCVHHDDAYPESDGELGLKPVHLAGRSLGQDFSGKDGFSTYHGNPVSGFPGHPHRGFETVTIVRKGLVDHSDSLGASARFGGGDVQWLTAGRGIVHSEMFPLLAADKANPLELFQIWLNLPAASKMAPPHFTMFWHEAIPRSVKQDASGRQTEVVVIAGSLQADTKAGEQAISPLAPPPDSWASREQADVAIWMIRMAPGALWTLPVAFGRGTRRSLYFFKGQSISVAAGSITSHCALELQADAPVELVNTGATVAEFLVLQGKPIAEPVVQYGPFVMNSQAEIRQTMQEYQRTQFGSWPWPDHAPTHGRNPARFATHPGGRQEKP